MRVVLRTHWFAVGAILWLAATTAWAGQPRRVVQVHPAAMMEESEPVAPQPHPVAEGSLWQPPPMVGPYESDDCGGECDSGCNSCCQYCFNGGCCRQGVWYGGGDYLLVRPRFSQDVAYYASSQSTDTTVTPNVTVTSAQAVQFPFQYQSAYRTFLGYHLWDCGGDIQFTYWNLQGSANAVGGPAIVNQNSSVLFTGQFGNMAATAGQFLAASSNVQANIFDFDFAKCLNLGGAQGPCCDCCPRWDLRWSAGVRGARVNRNDNNQVIDPDQSITATGQSNATFSGAGPRIGLQGRRYIGACGVWSLYARGNTSLLLGEFNQTRTQNVPGATASPTTITTQKDSFRRMIPVSEIEVGGTWQVTPRFFFSAGWFFQCWWDLGVGETQESIAFTPLDTSNIMAWDGLFLRGELIF